MTIQKQQTKNSTKTKEAPQPVEAKGRSDETQAKLDKSDSLLDEIDEALQGLESDFATTYVQKGGE